MSVKRYIAAAVVLDESRLWVTGGSSLYPNFLASTEYVSLNASKRGTGPDMPLALWNHCLVKIDATHVMLIGMKVISLNSRLNSNSKYIDLKLFLMSLILY